eukprot:tig00000241_g21006.t1
MSGIVLRSLAAQVSRCAAVVPAAARTSKPATREVGRVNLLVQKEIRSGAFATRNAALAANPMREARRLMSSVGSALKRSQRAKPVPVEKKEGKSAMSKVGSFLGDIKFDLGAAQLARDWSKLMTTENLAKDVQAGITVACVAVPLSLAIALGSGVPAEVGLITAIIGGAAASIFGGTPLAISGPAAALSFVCYECVQKFGIEGLIILTGTCGILQVSGAAPGGRPGRRSTPPPPPRPPPKAPPLLTPPAQIIFGMLRLGGLGRFVPMPVIAGFTTGIGTMVLTQQLPVALDLPKPPSSHIIDVLPHIVKFVSQTNPHAIFLALATVAVSLVLPKIPVINKFPASLFAVISLTLLNVGLDLDVSIIGKIPDSLPPMRLPDFSRVTGSPAELMGVTAVVFGVASVESLLSSSAVDKLAKGRVERHDPDQELIGQGVANASVALFGGMPVSSVIVRSSLNVNAGGMTRRSGIFQSATLIAIVFALAPYMSEIPLPVLSGMLLTVAIRMLSPHEIKTILKVDKAEGAVWAATAAGIVLKEVMSGVGVGMVVALTQAAMRKQFGKMTYAVRQDIPVRLETLTPLEPIDPAAPAPAALTDGSPISVPAGCEAVDYVALAGPVTFVQSATLTALMAAVGPVGRTTPLVINLEAVTHLDVTGAEFIVDILNPFIVSGRVVRFTGATEALEAKLVNVDHSHVMEKDNVEFYYRD